MEYNITKLVILSVFMILFTVSLIGCILDYIRLKKIDAIEDGNGVFDHIMVFTFPIYFLVFIIIKRVSG